ncbi:YcxB family protein [Sulfitobacter donghicola]|uniref:YcxB-like C-terminal domain-containing protein n=1 Tax=Sulfitobacter donghicola DSW-25 = KCTC 12864 = JCM 14565 TaxID=1300350 RepID=A0A073IH55_9RHOB|nr:YcxB family protein [Sulfitobacter donghicola]KEJ88890.1 hypothetical protein DSW25_14115 [Sulfitobacter donghicola DSW-25 = KCTC 12864 = JCM 14565]KIN68568.1 hypothetical protein Z948_2299 [Sulfitobacter donghicola DSW-25 = KCTC 12864 = JCM 14565]
MSNTYVLKFTPEPKVLLSVLRLKPPVQQVKGMKASNMLRLLHCLLLVLGGISLGYFVTDIFTDRATILHWSSLVGLALSYLAIFGSLLVTLPTMVRQLLATRANQGEVEMTINASGITTKADHFQSTIEWSAVEGLGRSKLAFVLWFGGNRPAIPFAAFASSEQIEAFEIDVKNWVETSR